MWGRIRGRGAVITLSKSTYLTPMWPEDKTADCQNWRRLLRNYSLGSDWNIMKHHYAAYFSTSWFFEGMVFKFANHFVNTKVWVIGQCKTHNPLILLQLNENVTTSFYLLVVDNYSERSLGVLD